MPSLTPAQAYKTVAIVAKPSQSEGLKKKRAILLLWFLRHVYGIDDLEAYEFICDGDKDQGVDGLYLEEADGEDEPASLSLFQSKYPTAANLVGVNEIKTLIGGAEAFLSAEGLGELLSNGVEPELENLITRFALAERLQQDKLLLKVVFVTAGKLTPQARKLIRTTNQNRAYQFLTAYDVLDLAPIVKAFRSPTTVKGKFKVDCDKQNRFVCEIADGRVVVCKVPVDNIVKWPGIADRRLFDLNVRRELSRNRVRRELDRAIKRKTDHGNFVAYHNGLTVVCKKIDLTDPAYITVRDFSVVNGAQSTIAFKENEDVVTEDLSVIVKFVEVPAEAQLAREVARRSNTQNPVNARNLRARDGIQLRLQAEFQNNYPDVTYEIRPDASVVPATADVIQNDAAAQLITAIYREEPWLAVKRLALFEAETYPKIFNPALTADHVMLADLIAKRVQEAKDAFPAEYRRSWRLTQLVAVYLVGQMLRTDEAPDLLDDPKNAMNDFEGTKGSIDKLVKFAAATLKVRHDKKKKAQQLDDFKVDFKRESELLELGDKAREHYLVLTTTEGSQ